MTRASVDGRPPYRVRIEPMFGVQARVRVWHLKRLVLDTSLWSINVRARAESVARVAIARDREALRVQARAHRLDKPP